MRCIFCDSQINKISIASLLYENDELCVECRNKLKINRKVFYLQDLKIETLYDYDSGIFRDLLIQYKECKDEALKDVFLYGLLEYIKIKYWNYSVLYVPSSKSKISERGFNHLPMIFSKLHFKQVDGLKMRDELVQEGKNSSQRRQMLTNYVYEGKPLKNVLIVDDVLTTGSSVLGVYNAIKPYSKRVKALILAKKENAFIFENKCAKIIR